MVHHAFEETKELAQRPVLVSAVSFHRQVGRVDLKQKAGLWIASYSTGARSHRGEIGVRSLIPVDIAAATMPGEGAVTNASAKPSVDPFQRGLKVVAFRLYQRAGRDSALADGRRQPATLLTQPSPHRAPSAP